MRYEYKLKKNIDLSLRSENGSLVTEYSGALSKLTTKGSKLRRQALQGCILRLQATDSRDLTALLGLGPASQQHFEASQLKCMERSIRHFNNTSFVSTGI
jgi:hypothetical protein